MKRLFNILWVLALSVVVMSGCKKFEKEIFENSSSERVQILMDTAYETLTSSEQGWYFAEFPGWSNNYKIGGYWFWCKFNKDYTVEAATEMTDISGYPAGTTAKSPFDIIRGNGAVISFNVFNPVLDYFSMPSFAAVQGAQGDIEFQIVEVTPDVVTVKGIRSGTTMKFVKKTDNNSVEETLAGISVLKVASMPFGAKLDVTVKGAYENAEYNIAPPSASRTRRVFTLRYTEFKGMLEEEIEVQPGVFETRDVPDVESFDVIMPFSPNMDDSGVTLSEPVTVLGKTITGFTYNAEAMKYTSNDADGTITIVELVDNPLNVFFATSSWAVGLAESDFGPELFQLLEEGKVSLMDSDSESLVSMSIQQVSQDTSEAVIAIPSFCFDVTGPYGDWASFFLLTLAPVAGSIDKVAITYDAPGLNGDYPGYADAWEPLVEKISDNSPYLLETDNSTFIRLVSESDPSIFFTVYL